MPSKSIAECNQSGCDAPAAFRFTWPGRDEAGICAFHAFALCRVADAMSLPVQIIQLLPEDYVRAAKESAHA